MSKQVRPAYDHYGLTATQSACRTRITRGYDERNMHNRKPYRTAAMKEQARERAKRDEDGAWRSPVPTLLHTDPREHQPA